MRMVGGKKTRASARETTAESAECAPTVSSEHVLTHQIDFRECAFFSLSACCSVPLAVFWARFTPKASLRVGAFNGVHHVCLHVFVCYINWYMGAPPSFLTPGLMYERTLLICHTPRISRKSKAIDWLLHMAIALAIAKQ